MLNNIKALELARHANDFTEMSNKLLSVNDLLYLAIRKSKNDWEGMASEAFTEQTLHIQKSIISLMGDLIQICNSLLIESENILAENSDEEQEGTFSGGGGGGGGGGRF